MKKVLAFLVVLGLILGSGAALNVSADSGDEYFDWPSSLLPPPR